MGGVFSNELNVRMEFLVSLARPPESKSRGVPESWSVRAPASRCIARLALSSFRLRIARAFLIARGDLGGVSGVSDGRWYVGFVVVLAAPSIFRWLGCWGEMFNG